ncbi:MAG: M3 family metallopeptidase [Phocaeicola sp.]
MNIENNNPFLIPYSTPYQSVPFHLIQTAHYKPAILEGIAQQNREIEEILKQEESPTFLNTIVALEQSGALLDRVTTVLFNQLSAETSDALQEVAEEMTPLLTEHGNNISLNPTLFQRVATLYAHREELALNTEEDMLLFKSYNSFVRNGANLVGEEKEKYRSLSTNLSKLTLRFSQNKLKESNGYTLLLSDSAQLAGLPESAIQAAAQTATEKGETGKWAFTLQAPSLLPFLKYSQVRALRQELFMAYNTQCIGENEYNNESVVKELVNCRMELAQLLGYPTYADYVLQKRMAEKVPAVYDLLHKLLDAYKPAALQEVQEVEALARQTEGEAFTLMPWDWAFYSEQLKNQTFQFSEEELRPYFELNRVKEGVFGLATQLYGITFQENTEIPCYHPDVKAYEVLDKDGSFLSLLYTDFHPRESKQSGAWMTSYKEQWMEKHTNSRPHISITMNFTKPTAEQPALLTFSEVTTFLHEFGHALHGIFANSTYQSLSGTNVYWDFVELPSQIMENFATEKAFLNTFAKHYQTEEEIPEAFIQKIKDSANFAVGYNCLRQLSFGLLDMAWYTRTEPFTGDVRAYEKEINQATKLLPSVAETCMSVQFSHIMAGGYSAGYYSYKWAEVLDADAFARFQEKGILSSEVAEQFRIEILSKGGSEHPMTLYKRFRGAEPTIDALLKRNGIESPPVK